ncbi:LysR family transcriptional regulator [Futiania mangrovi]|uniref:LysR family transcriptional regulator n=1 Tax=Futiania mangrovi TaxID=2959716 RepID=A0A9J6PCH9_9PROT|nr:LysR family transcriptional regulator [Futiania mangrovii]MCP1337029.1 LysR family transcriptional regulator [Futiania mangrovii]
MALTAAQGLIDSRRLFYFYHVARAGRFKTAEALLGVAQSAMSRQIQALEADLGAQLLERTGHGVRLTEPGEIVFRHAEEILGKMLQAKGEIRAAAQNIAENVSIAGPPTFMYSYMPEIINRFRRDFPHCSVSLVEAGTGSIYPYLSSGEVDIAIVIQIPNSTKLEFEQLFAEDMYLMAAPGDPVAGEGVARRERIHALDHILPASLHGSKEIIKKYFEAGGFSINCRFHIDSLSLTRILLCQGGVCSILPRAACRTELEEGKLLALPLDPPLQRTLYLARVRDRELTPETQAFMRLIADVVAEKGV